jgi:thymidylate synthase
MQHVLVFQRNRMGEGKVKAILELGSGMELRLVDLTGPFPPLIDDPEEHFPADLPELLSWADLVLDHVYHADLTGFLLDRCEAAAVPVIASGRKLTRAHTPTTCCTLGKLEGLGEYARHFGAPEFQVEVRDGKISSISVLRGAPCAATWKAASSVVGLSPEEALPRIGLATQFHCYAKANPNVFLTNPLHVAGEVHTAALRKALARARGEEASDAA